MKTHRPYIVVPYQPSVSPVQNILRRVNDLYRRITKSSLILTKPFWKGLNCQLYQSHCRKIHQNQVVQNSIHQCLILDHWIKSAAVESESKFSVAKIGGIENWTKENKIDEGWDESNTFIWEWGKDVSPNEVILTDLLTRVN